MIQLTPRNGTQLNAKFSTLTVAIDHLSSSYIDRHYAELDEIQAETVKLRREALEASKAEWSDIDCASIVASLLGAIEVAEDGEPDSDGVINPAIVELRESDLFKSALAKAMPLAGVMGREGTAYRLVMLERKFRLHQQAGEHWRIACCIDLDGDLSKYLGYSVKWPVLSGRAANRMAAVEQRVEILEHLTSDDIEKLKEAFEAYKAKANGLTEAESKN